RGYEDGGFVEQPGAGAVVWQGHSPEALPLHTAYAVVPRQALVQKRVVGVEQVGDWAVLPNDAAEEQLHLRFERFTQVVVEVEQRLGTWLVRLDISDMQPLTGEVVDERLRFLIGQHP